MLEQSFSERRDCIMYRNFKIWIKCYIIYRKLRSGTVVMEKMLANYDCG